jgi:hypothetical protein
MSQTGQVRVQSRDYPIDDPAVKSRCCEETTERMSSILLLPCHGPSTCFSRLFGASIGLLMITKVKCTSRGNVDTFFALVSCRYNSNALFFLKPNCMTVLWLYYFALLMREGDIQLWPITVSGSFRVVTYSQSNKEASTLQNSLQIF